MKREARLTAVFGVVALAALIVCGCESGAPTTAKYEPVVAPVPKTTLDVAPVKPSPQPEVTADPGPAPTHRAEVPPVPAPEPRVDAVRESVPPAFSRPMLPGRPAPALVKRCARPPVIDGDLSDACWKGTEIGGVWADVYTGEAPKLKTMARVSYDDRNLYVAFHNPEPRMKDLMAEAVARDGAAWSDDSNELYIDPTAGKKDYCQFIVNTKEVVYDGRGRDGDWDSKIKVAVKKMADGWSLEMAIPLKDLGVTGSPKGQTWTANFCRNRQTQGEAEAQAWADTGESFHNPEAFGKLKFE